MNPRASQSDHGPFPVALTIMPMLLPDEFKVGDHGKQHRNKSTKPYPTF